MNEVQKWTFYLMMLVAGFATGIGTIGLFPQMWLKYGITGLAVHVVFLVVLTVLAIAEVETVMKSGYFFTELYYKVTRKPGMIIALLTIGIMFLSYYTANVGLSLLSPFLGTGTVGRLVAKIVVIAIIFVVISRAKEKTFLIMAIGSLFLVVLVPMVTILSIVQIPKDAAYLSIAKDMLFDTHPITWDLIRAAADRAIYGVGLGFGFYIMLGSFINERFNPKLIISTGIFIQLILGILSTIALVYMVTPTDPGTFLIYANGGEEQAIELMGKLPDILANHPLILYILGLGIFMVGLTSILPTAEVDLQILHSILRVDRSRVAAYLMGIVLLVGILDSPPSVADMMLKAVSTALFVTAIFELYPIVAGRKKLSLLHFGVALVATVIFLVGFLSTLFRDIKLGGLYYASIFLALLIIALGFVGELFTPREEAA